MELNQAALLNEYKGNLFEFLVAKNLAELTNTTANFFEKISPSYLQMLQFQEQYLRDNNEKLLHLLTFSSHQMAEFIYQKYKMSGVFLVGKLKGNDLKTSFDEADIVLLLEDKQELGVSLKFTKDHSWLNTKSAGMKSFFEKYFQFPDVQFIQNEFNKKAELQFEILMRELHLHYNIEFDSSFNNWKKKNLPVHPGGLDEGAHKKLINYYQFLMNEFYQCLNIFYLQNPKKFNQAVQSLSGFSSSNIELFILFYAKNEIKLQRQIKQNFQVEKIIKTDSKSSFVIQLKNAKLQIRIKPMKTFLQPSFKVNCSLKLC